MKTIRAEDRFTDRSRQVIVLARESATQLEQDHAGTQNVLLGLIREGSGVAAAVLGYLGVSVEAVEQAVEQDTANDWTVQHIAEAALRQAVWQNHNYIGTAELLLGICTLSPSVATEVLRHVGVEPREVCREVIQLLGHDWERWALDHENTI